ncbi:MAG TPA: AgmX/PglI C-terminal domain-containing protein [Kofleriaceae bacterium]
MSTTSPRSIRVGVLLGNSLVEERVFPATAPVTIGQSLKCALSLPVDGLPHEHVLFAVDQGRVIINIPDKMQARIAQGGTIKTELHGAVMLEQGARGRLELGEATVLFQEVATVAKTPRMQLPASVRGTLGDRVDRRLALIISGSILAHCAIATWAWVSDRESDTSALFEPAVAYEQSVYTITAPDFGEPEPGEPGAATPVAPDIQTPTAGRPTSRPSPGRPRMPSESDAEYFAKILAGNGETGRAPEMQGRRPGADLGTQIDHIRDTKGKIGTDGNGGFREQGEVRPGTTDGPRITGPDGVTEIKKDDKEQTTTRIDIKIPKKGPPETTLTAEMVLQKIRTNYMPGLQRCYKAGLASDGSLGGTVDIAFTVGENGAVQDPSADGLTSTVDACIAGQMASWRFPIPRDKAGEPDEAAFQVALVLKAN